VDLFAIRILIMMTPSARLSARLKSSPISRHVAAGRQGLKDWGLAHRFAGSATAPPSRASSMSATRKGLVRWIMGADPPRARAAACWRGERAWMHVDRQAERRRAPYAPNHCATTSMRGLRAASLEGAPEHVLGDYPEWPMRSSPRPSVKAGRGGQRSLRGAPLDLRVNTLKASREEAAEAIGELKPQPARWSPIGLRVVSRPIPKVRPFTPSLPSQGQIEIQDEVSACRRFWPAPNPASR